MLNTKRRPFIATALLLTSLGVTTSCIDNSYDLNKDIDMTVNVGGEHLAIPVGYTEQITLDKNKIIRPVYWWILVVSCSEESQNPAIVNTFTAFHWSCNTC